MNNKQNATKLQDAISDLKIVDNMVSRNKISAAREELQTLSEYVMVILGGNKEVRELMDKWQSEFNQRYVQVMAN